MKVTIHVDGIVIEYSDPTGTETEGSDHNDNLYDSVATIAFSVHHKDPTRCTPKEFAAGLMRRIGDLIKTMEWEEAIGELEDTSSFQKTRHWSSIFELETIHNHLW